MSTKKKNASAPASERQPKNNDGAIKDILAIIRQYEPEDQNIIIDKILTDIGTDRHFAVENCASMHTRACKNSEIFFAGNEKAICMVKEHISKSNNSNKKS